MTPFDKRGSAGIPQKSDETDDKVVSTASECTSALSYNALDRVLTVQFQKRGTYEYDDVDAYTAAEFMFVSGSKGVYFNRYIKDRYEYERIS